MISRLKGNFSDRAGCLVTIDVNGVGYEITATSALLNRLDLLEGDKIISVVVSTDVREDAINLYGFDDHLEKQVFLLLRKVNGLGARTACDIISKIDKRELLRAIGSGDIHKLQSVKGIGRKKAERIVVELRDQVGMGAVGPLNENIEISKGSNFQNGLNDALQGLLSLGFGRKEAEAAISKVRDCSDLATLSSGEIIREALRFV